MFKGSQLSIFDLWRSRLGALLLVFTLALLMATIPAAPAAAQAAISWDDLQTHSTRLRNPYEHLSEAQTYRLSSLHHLKEWAEENPSAPDSIEAKEIQRLEQALAAEGLDTDTLLVHADEARAYWRSQSQITNPDLEEHSVQLSGYILPLGDAQADSRAQQVSEFLLVPYVGACIHVPTPPPNQMVYIKPTAAIENPGLFSAVQVTGKLRSHSGRYELFRVDGSRTVEVSYAMDLEAIAQAPTDSSALGRQITGPWWRSLPARVSNVLTVSLGNLSRQTSPRTLIMAMLLSFSYGVLHTLGPGHGKAVIVSYFVGNGGSMRRGILMGVRIAVFHVLSAVVIVVFTDQLVQQVGGSSASSYRVVQLISYGAIALIGGWMLRQALQKRNVLHSLPDVASGNGATVETMLYPSLSQQLALSDTGQLDTRLQKSVSRKIVPPENSAVLADCSCLVCEDPQGIGGWLALAVGAVPCSGALLVLLYGLANDMLWPSVGMVVSISVGMAFTLAWIGALAILGNRYGYQAAARQQQKRFPWGKASPNPNKPNPLARFSLVRIGQVVSASCILLVGTSLFLLTLTA